MNTPMDTTEVFSTLLIALLIIPVVLAVTLKAPKLVAYSFIVALCLFSYSSWGEIEIGNNLYSRGVGMFNFSLINLALFVAGIAVIMKKLAPSQGPSFN